LRDWLARALQLDTRRAFAAAPEAHAALEEVMAADSMYVAAPVALETFLSRYITALLEPAIDECPPDPPALVVGNAPVQAATRRPSTPAPSIVSPLRPVPDRPPAPRLEPARDSAAAKRPAPQPVAPPPAARPSAAPAVDAEPDAPPAQIAAAHDIRELLSGESRPAAHDIRELLRGELPPLAPTGSDKPPLFESESPFEMPPPTPGANRPRRAMGSRRLVLLVAAILVLGGGVYASRLLFSTTDPLPDMGTLIVESNPSGVQVFVDGVDRGPTPARLSVTPGAHILELRGRGTPRVIPFTLEAGARVSHHLEFSNSPETGRLRVESQPGGATVIVDGVDRGTAPVTVEDLVPGDHEVILQTSAGPVRQVVAVHAGATASLVAPVAGPPQQAPGPVSGWISVKAPVTLQILEGNRVVGTSDTERIMMAAGRHDVELVNEALGYRATRGLQVEPGKVTSIAVELPNGMVNLNAIPWAEVWIDGQRVGETPIGNLSVPIGPHEVIFRHPQFGEKRHAISVTLAEPVRVSINMR
ncbi:MAG TPA: PEGA domain-containing protein, partial [Vicinamibacterales bacterium]|nr:PEGA domain-containing protein [Vicinamibacterales bacterium]